MTRYYIVDMCAHNDQILAVMARPLYVMRKGQVGRAAAGAACWTRSQRMEAVPAKVRNGHSALV